MRRRRTALSFLLALVTAGALMSRVNAAPPAGDTAVQAPAGVVGHAGRWLVDAQGRVVVIHGTNMATKWGDAYPSALGFGEDDATLLAASGVNAVRLTVERYKVAPQPGVFDDAYVARFAETVRMLAAHGIMSLIDFHQDSWGPMFFDNGFPEWMTMTDGLPNVYQVGFPFQYLANPALNRAFDHFWANDIGPSGRPLQDDDADILTHAVAQLAPLDGILGYEILNEPWPGSQYATCVVPVVGCPVFDQGAYSAYYARIIPKLRAADPRHVIWYEPHTLFNDGVPTSMTLPPDPNLGFAFHDYPLCAAADDGAAGAGLPSPPDEVCTPFDSLVMDNAEAHSAATGSALLQTEFGATTDLTRLQRQLDIYDEHMMPWMFWSYGHYVVPEQTPGGAIAPADEAHVNDAMLRTLTRPYPQLVSGTPEGWRFDAATSTFTFTYATARAAGDGTFGHRAETAIAVPAIAYPGGYRAHVAGGRVTSRAGAPILRVQAAKDTPRVTVTVRPR